MLGSIPVAAIVEAQMERRTCRRAGSRFILATNSACQFVGIFVGIDHN
jgi:hypothetical protein